LYIYLHNLIVNNKIIILNYSRLSNAGAEIGGKCHLVSVGILPYINPKLYSFHVLFLKIK
jgi:hypothetical protein